MKRILCSLIAAATIAAGARTAAAAEVCGDGYDNDGDAYADDGCDPAGVTGVCESPLGCDRASVAPTTGALTLAAEADFDVRTPYGPALAFRRHYASHYQPGYFPGGVATSTHPFGHGWQHGYMSWLRKDAVRGEVVLHTTEGRDVRFARVATNVGGWDEYRPQPGQRFDVLRQRVAAPYDWELVGADGVTHVYDFDGATARGKLTAIRDRVARQITPNHVAIAYDASGQVSRVTSIGGHRWLELTYDTTGRRFLRSVALYTNPSQPQLAAQRDFAYDGDRLASVAEGGQVLERYAYDAAGGLAAVRNAAQTVTEASFAYDQGRISRATVAGATVGYEYDAPACEAGAGTFLFYDRGATASCTTDAQCGAGFCGGKVNGTGQCFKARRCMAFDRSKEHVITKIFASCPTCAHATEYAYDFGSLYDELAVTGIRDVNGRATTRLLDAAGNTITAIRGDDDLLAGNGGPADSIRTEFFFDDPAHPHLPTEIRARSRMGSGTCDRTTTTGCRRTLFTYDAAGQVLTREERGFTMSPTVTTTAYSYTTTRTYDGLGRPTFIYGPRPGIDDDVEYTYHTSGIDTDYLATMRRRTGAATWIVSSFGLWDGAGRPGRLTGPDGKSVCQSYSGTDHRRVDKSRIIVDGNHASCFPGANDQVWDYDWDDERMTKLTAPRGNCVRIAWAGFDRMDNVVTADRDPATGACSATGESHDYNWDDDARLVAESLLDAGGGVFATQTFTYAPDDRLLLTIPNPANPAYAKTLIWDDDRWLKGVELEDHATTGARSERDVDWQRQTTAVRRYLDASTAVENWLVRDLGVAAPDLIGHVDEMDHEIEAVWDDLGRQVSVQLPEGGQTVRVFDPAGNVLQVIAAFGSADQVTTTYTYDLADRITAVDVGDPNCGAASGPEIQYAWDALPAGVTCPSGSTCNNLGGRVARVRTQLWCTTTGDLRFDQATFYSYTTAGRVAQHTTVDDAGRTSRVQYLYDVNGNNTRIEYPSSSAAAAQYTLGSAGGVSDDERVTAVLRNLTPMVDQVTWKPGGQLAGYRMKNGFLHGSTTYYPQLALTYNAAGRAETIDTPTGWPGERLLRIELGEDVRGRRTKRDFTGGSATQRDQYFRHDNLTRLTCATPTLVTSCPTSGVTPLAAFGYDAAGDRTSLTFANAVSPAATYAMVYRSLGGVPSRQLERLDRAGGGSITYGWDARGNRISDDDSAYVDDGREMFYDARNNLIGVTGRRAVNVHGVGWQMQDYVLANAYDERNRRVFKSFAAGGVEQQWFFTYDLADRLIEVVHVPAVGGTSTWTHQWYWLGHRPVAHYSSLNGGTPDRELLVSDEQERVHAVWSWPYSGNPTRVWDSEAGAFGWDVPSTNFFQPWRFPGQWYDGETEAVAIVSGTRKLLRPGLADNRFRTYDSFTGSYLQVDPLVWSTREPYVYVSQAPGEYVDPTGLEEGNVITVHECFDPWAEVNPITGHCECPYPMAQTTDDYGAVQCIAWVPDWWPFGGGFSDGGGGGGGGGGGAGPGGFQPAVPNGPSLEDPFWQPPTIPEVMECSVNAGGAAVSLLGCFASGACDTVIPALAGTYGTCGNHALTGGMLNTLEHLINGP